MAATTAIPVAATTTTNGITRAVPIKNTALPELTAEQTNALNRAKQYAVQESIKYVLIQQETHAKLALQAVAANTPQQVPGMANEHMVLQKQQALVLMCRVYVGSIYYDLKEEVIRNAFAPFGPFKSIDMPIDPITGRHKGFAFIEYQCPEAAQLAMDQMGGVMLGGRSIKVGRPANMPRCQPVIDLLLAESKQQKRIYVSSVHSDLNTDDLKAVFSAFGTILTCSLATDPIYGKHKGYGFIEYETLQSANDAVGSMNLFDLGGQYLRVGKAIAGVTLPAGSSFNNNPINQIGSTPTMPFHNTYPNLRNPFANINTFPNLPQVPQFPGIGMQNRFMSPSMPVMPHIPPPSVMTATPVVANQAIPPPGVATPVTLASKSSGAQKKEENLNELPNTLSAQEDVKLSGVEARHMIMHKLMRKEESKVMILRNMVDAQDIDDDLESEVTDECGKFGSVNRVVIYQEKQSDDEDAMIIVKIFVEFEQVEFCAKATEALNKRWFGGRQIEATAYSQQQFDDNDLSG